MTAIDGGRDARGAHEHGPGADVIAGQEFSVLPTSPPRFSTTNCCPVTSLIAAQKRRDSVSVGPPAG